jgi:hypothetical protein
MHYLIDGHNLIGKMPDISLTDPDDVVNLVLRLRQWTAARQKRRVTVIFDGGLPGGAARHLSSRPVKVIFATEGSSDREVQAAAKARKMPLVLSGTFAARLKPDPSERDVSETPAEPSLDEEEVAEWLELFGPEPEPEEISALTGRKSPQSLTNDNSLKESVSKGSQRKAPPNTSKEGTRKLSENEVDEWLEIFGEADDK